MVYAVGQGEAPPQGEIVWQQGFHQNLKLEPGEAVTGTTAEPEGSTFAACTSTGCTAGGCPTFSGALLDSVKLGRSVPAPLPTQNPVATPNPQTTSEPIASSPNPATGDPASPSIPSNEPSISASAVPPGQTIPQPTEPSHVIRESTLARDHAALSGKVPSRTSVMRGDQFDQIRESMYVADNARGVEFVETALNRKREIEQAAQQDSDTLTSAFDRVSLAEAPQALERAKNYLRDTAAKLETAQSGMFPGELARFRNLYLNAADKADAASSILQDHARTQVPETLKLPFNPFDLQTLGKAKTPEIRDLSELLGGATAGDALHRPGSTSEDALINRMVMFGGLKNSARQDAQKNLGLIYVPELTLAGGKKEEIPILHNGYILGANSKTALDCSSFVSEMLSPRSRGMRLTTLDFLQMWRFQKTGQFIKPPRYAPDREDQVRDLARSFIPIDIYKGERLASGDFLIYRQPSDPIGHIVLVKKYDPKLDRVTMIDAAQSAGTIRERELQLSLTNRQGQRMVRAGFIALRMKANNNTACQYKR